MRLLCDVSCSPSSICKTNYERVGALVGTLSYLKEDLHKDILICDVDD